MKPKKRFLLKITNKICFLVRVKFRFKLYFLFIELFQNNLFSILPPYELQELAFCLLRPPTRMLALLKN